MSHALSASVFLWFAILFFNLIPIAARSGTNNNVDSNPDVDEGDYQKMSSTVLINTNATLPTLITVDEVMRLKPEEAELGFPVDLHGIVTCVVQEHNAFIIQDSTRAVFITPGPSASLPQRGELVEVRGKSDKGTFAPLVRASDTKNLGPGTLPQPVQPTWDQLMNGSLDDQQVELAGIVEQGIPKPPGYPSHWSKIILRTTEGPLWVDVWFVGHNFDTLTNYEDAVVRLRGCLFVALTTDTHQLELGHVRMYVDSIDVQEPAPSDKFSAPEKRAAELIRFDPEANSFQRVRLSGQVLYMIGRDFFMMDGTNGVRFTLRRSVELHTGDYADVVGYPELNGAAPHLRAAIARKTGHGPLPKPRVLLPDDFPNAIYDSTRVRIDGSLVSSRSSPTNETLEIQSGSWRFVARVKLKNTNAPPIGSRLGLTGVYFTQGGNPELEGNVAPFDLLVHSPADITILSKPAWWTLPRLLVVVGILVLALTLLALWVTELHRQVEQRTAELAIQMHDRERVERQRAMEQERARIAQDLHDELGSGITEISMLATVAGTAPVPGSGSNGHLMEISDRAREMVTTLDEIVWAMNPKHDSLQSLVSYSFLYADRLLKLANIACLFKGAVDLPNRPVSSVYRHEFFLAFKEAITNVVRHSAATNVRLAVHLIGDRLRLSIADNGRGLPSEAFTGDGLVNMRTRLEKMGGRFAITSQSGRGTTVRFYIPLG
ncbi:MAG TPA: sensor histidine kinase [Pseudomonadales bacterium]|nr:sensor histidine kinase [Pseudomonadales bacterium]